MPRATFLFAVLLAACPGAQVPSRAESNPSPAQVTDLRARFGQVKSWRVTYQYSGENPLAWDDHGAHFVRSRWSEASQGDFILRTTHSGAMSLQAFEVAPAQQMIAFDLIKISGPEVETRYDSGNASGTVKVELELDLARGVYRFDLLPNDIATVYGGMLRNPNETRRYGPAAGTSHVIIPLPGDDQGLLPLPDRGQVLSGTWTHQQSVERMARRAPGFDAGEYARAKPVHGELKWRIEPADSPPAGLAEVPTLPPIVVPAQPGDAPGQPLADVELKVEPAEYETWMPRGGADEHVAGNTLTLKATLVPRGGGELTHRATWIAFALTEVSHEPGVALNFPVHGAVATPDLAFEAARNPQAQIDAEGATARFLHGPYTSVTAQLSSFDWGACGAVKVWARLDDGRIILGRMPAGGAELLVPKRAAGSHIADAWKAAVGYSDADGADDDEQPGNPHPGDGLTAYEEYRGLVVGGRSTRDEHGLDPAKKDLVVINSVGADGRAGAKRFAGLSGIGVLVVNASDLPEDRCINANHGATYGGAQYAVRISAGSVAAPGVGELRPTADVHASPRFVEDVIFDRAAAVKAYAARGASVGRIGEPLPYAEADDLAQVVARLLALSVGAREHGDVPDYDGPREITAQSGAKVFGADGKPVAAAAGQPIVLAGRIGRPGNPDSGDSGCLLCQPNDYAWAAVGKDGRPFAFYAIPAQPLGDHLCTSKRPLGLNVPHRVAGGGSVPGVFGYAEGRDFRVPRGNCLGALQVRDW